MARRSGNVESEPVQPYLTTAWFDARETVNASLRIRPRSRIEETRDHLFVDRRAITLLYAQGLISRRNVETATAAIDRAYHQTFGTDPGEGILRDNWAFSIENEAWQHIAPVIFPEYKYPKE